MKSILIPTPLTSIQWKVANQRSPMINIQPLKMTTKVHPLCVHFGVLVDSPVSQRSTTRTRQTVARRCLFAGHPDLQGFLESTTKSSAYQGHGLENNHNHKSGEYRCVSVVFRCYRTFLFSLRPLLSSLFNRPSQMP